MDHLWEECADENGRIFYVNRATQETQWELPPDGLLVAQLAPEEAEPSLTENETTDIPVVLDNCVQQLAFNIRQKLLPNATDAMWIQSFDPFRGRVYYYEWTSGQLADQAPESFSLNDPLASWCVTLQCFIRSALARRRVAHRRFQKRFPAVKHPVELLPLVPETEAQREADDRRGMLLNEKAQCSLGDHFWGIDQYAREVRRQLLEEDMLREAEEMRRKLNESAKRREESLRKAAEEQERKRRSEDNMLETQERQAMQLQELQQCKVDTFWGVQKQENDERCCQEHMVQEDIASRRYAQDLYESQLHGRWAMDAARALELEKKRRLGEEIKHQKQYLKLFNRAKTSEEIINYNWPTLQVVKLEEPRRRTKDTNQNIAYNLDVVLDPERRANPKHIFHSTSSSHTVGRKGKLEFSKPPPCFHLEKPHATPKKPNPNQSATANGLPFQVHENAGIDAVLSKTLEKPKKLLPSLTPAEEPISDNQQVDHKPPEPLDDNSSLFIEQFTKEEAVLQKIFALIDTDHGGTIDKNEMIWALTRDAMVHKLAMDSIVFRDVLKKRNLENLFEEMDELKTGYVSWEVFLSYCKKAYHILLIENERKLREQTPQIQLSKEELLKKKNADYQARKAILDQEEAIARLVFALVDTDRSGTIDQNEMMHALEFNTHVRGFVQRSRGLQPLLTNPTFAKAFIGMATDVEKGMSLDEFMCFCTEIASVAMLNGMVPT